MKIDENGGKEGGGRGQKGAGGLSRNGGLPYYTEVFLEILQDAA